MTWKIFAGIFLLFYTQTCFSSLQDPASLRQSYRDITSRLLQSISLPFLREHGEKVVSVVFGNPFYGYFEILDFQEKKNSIDLKFIPPGYQYPVNFFVKVGDGETTWLLKKRPRHFKSPLPNIFNQAAGKIVRGNFVSNYILLTGTMSIGRDKTSPRAATICYYYIVNRLGEVVWIYFPQSAEPGLMKPVSPGNYVLGLRSQLQYLDYKGHVHKTIIPQALKRPYILNMHHDFIPSPNGSVKALINKVAYATPLSQLFSPTEAYEGDSVITIEPTRGKVEAGWFSLNTFNPLFPAPGSFQDYDSETHFYRFANVNSIDSFGDRGYLLSLKNLSTVVWLDPTLKNVIATIGSNPKDTYRTKGERDRFYMQYHVTSTGFNEILFLDKGKRQSRIVKMFLDESTHSASVVKEFLPNPSVFARERGSAFNVHAKNTVVGFFPRATTIQNAGLPEWIDYLIEFDETTGKEKARMAFYLGLVNAQSYRANPLDAIGLETPFNMENRNGL